MANQSQTEQVFFSSIPSKPYPLFILHNFKTLSNLVEFLYLFIYLFILNCCHQLCTGGAFWPVFVIANVAALIASRAMTTATFSCIKQSTALGCFPRLKIIHTSRKFMGQIYIPVMNWFLLVICLTFVAMFGSINEIGNAYGTTCYSLPSCAALALIWWDVLDTILVSAMMQLMCIFFITGWTLSWVFSLYLIGSSSGGSDHRGWEEKPIVWIALNV